MTLRSIRAQYRFRRRKLSDFVVHNVLHADDCSHQLALGFAVGVFVAFTPTVGFQMLIAGFLSWLINANKALAAATVWISNPGTLVPIYWYCYGIGCAVLATDPIGRGWWQNLAVPPAGWWPTVAFYWSQFVDIAAPLWLGGIAVGLVCGYAGYHALFHTVTYYRARI